jgi:hypothetical protein
MGLIQRGDHGLRHGGPCGSELDRSYDDQVHRAGDAVPLGQWPQPPALCFADDLRAFALHEIGERSAPERVPWRAVLSIARANVNDK